MLFPNDYSFPITDRLQHCKICNEPRYKNGKVARNSYMHFSLIKWIQILLNSSMSKEMNYRSQYPIHTDRYFDVFDGKNYKKNIADGLFDGCYDVALGLTADGAKIFKTKANDCWPLVIVNFNLPPKLRRKREFLHIVGLIPGPCGPKDMNSFLWPLLDELHELEIDIPNCYHGNDNVSFTLHAYLICTCGDMPAVNKLACVTGHGGIFPCRFCKIQSISNGRYRYVPLTTPTANIPPASNATIRVENYDYFTLPLRTTQENMRLINATTGIINIDKGLTPTERKRFGTETGICGSSMLFSLEE